MNTIYRNAIEELVFHLDIMLVPHGKIEEMNDSHGYQIHFPWTAGDVAINDWTYHSDDGYVESWQFKFDDGDVTFKMPAEMAALIKSEYIEWKLNPRFISTKLKKRLKMKNKSLHRLIVLMEKYGKKSRRAWDRLKRSNQNRRIRQAYCSASSRVKKTLMHMQWG